MLLDNVRDPIGYREMFQQAFHRLHTTFGIRWLCRCLLIVSAVMIAFYDILVGSFGHFAITFIVTLAMMSHALSVFHQKKKLPHRPQAFIATLILVPLLVGLGFNRLFQVAIAFNSLWAQTPFAVWPQAIINGLVNSLLAISLLTTAHALLYVDLTLRTTHKTPQVIGKLTLKFMTSAMMKHIVWAIVWLVLPMLISQIVMNDSGFVGRLLGSGILGCSATIYGLGEVALYEDIQSLNGNLMGMLHH